jgi:selenocysteine lyase/cysteine desulfurase
MGPKKREDVPLTPQSGLVFQRSLREAPAAIDAIAWSRVSGNFLTVDSLALRVWSTERQLKSLHRSAGSDDTLAFRTFGAFALETADDAFAIVYSAKRKGQVTSVQVWSSSLVLMHDVELSCPPLQLMGLSPMRARGCVRFSLGIYNTEEDIDFLLSKLGQIIARLREISPLNPEHPDNDNYDIEAARVKHSEEILRAGITS